MTTRLLPMEELPSQTSSQVKSRWGEVVRQVQDRGVVAITHHSSVDLVLLSAGAYRSLREQLQALQAREQAEIDALSEQFKARLESLQHPQAHDRLAKVMAAKGKARKAPTAGTSY